MARCFYLRFLLHTEIIIKEAAAFEEVKLMRFDRNMFWFIKKRARNKACRVGERD